MIVPKGSSLSRNGRLTGAIQAEQDISFQAMRDKLNQFVQTSWRILT